MSNNVTWQRELSITVFSIAGSTLVFLPVAMLVSFFVSWGFDLLNLFGWLRAQSEAWFWGVLAVFSMLSIGAIMLWLDKKIESKLMPRLTNDKIALSLAVFSLLGAIILIYFIVSWFINFLNLTFWLSEAA